MVITFIRFNQELYETEFCIVKPLNKNSIYRKTMMLLISIDSREYLFHFYFMDLQLNSYARLLIQIK